MSFVGVVVHSSGTKGIPNRILCFEGTVSVHINGQEQKQPNSRLPAHTQTEPSLS